MKNKMFWGYFKKYRTKSVSIRYFGIFLCFILLMLIISGILFYSYANNIVYTQIKNSTLYDITSVKDLTDNVLVQAERLMTSLSVNKSVRIYMLSPLSGVENIEIMRNIKSYNLIYDYIDSVYIYAEGRNEIYIDSGSISVDEFSDGEWLTACIESKQNPHVSTFFYRRKAEGFPQLLSLVKPVSNNYGVPIGYVIININIRKLLDMLPIESKLTQCYIINEHGQIVYSNKENEFLQSIYDTSYQDKFQFITKNLTSVVKNEYIISSVDSNYFKIKFIAFVPRSEYAPILSNLFQFIASMILLMICMAVVGSILLSIRAYKPIKNIISVINSPEYLNKEYNNQNNEIDEVLNQIVNLVNMNRDFKYELSNRLDMLNKTYNIALQMQINPHFIYNTLEAINWKIVDYLDIDNSVSPMIRGLSRLMRYVLDADNNLVTLEEEIEHTKLYINIIKERYEDMVDVIWDVENDMQKMNVIRLLLQPIVENAVYHGIKPQQTNGKIYIKIHSLNGYINVKIEDDGIGMDEERMQEIRNNMDMQQILSGKHIGLVNVSQRIKLAFGNQYGLSLSKNSMGGLTVDLLMPMLTNKTIDFIIK